jgi:hypothetical protein
MSKQVRARNTVSGQIGIVPESYLTHPVLGKTLVQVDDDAKSYLPEMYQPTDAEGDAEKPSRARRVKAAEESTAPLDLPDAPALFERDDLTLDPQDL